MRKSEIIRRICQGFPAHCRSLAKTNIYPAKNDSSDKQERGERIKLLGVSRIERKKRGPSGETFRRFMLDVVIGKKQSTFHVKYFYPQNGNGPTFSINARKEEDESLLKVLAGYVVKTLDQYGGLDKWNKFPN